MGDVSRPFYCDKCGVELDKHDFYEMTMAHRVITVGERERAGRIFKEKKSTSHRTVPGIRLCKACAEPESERMRCMIDREVPEW